MLAYALRVPFKRGYHVLFILYAVACICFAFVIAYANAQLSPEANYEIARAALLVGPRVQLALLYHCTLNFEARKMNTFQTFTVIGAYAFAIFVGVGNALVPQLSISPGRLTATGVTPGVGMIGAYFRIPGTPLDAYYLVVEVLILYALFSYYQHAKSALVRVQIRYLSVGAIFDYLGVAALGIAVVFVGSGVPNFQSLITAVGTVVLLVGITRHGFYGAIPTLEAAAAVPPTYSLEDGRSYLSTDNRSSFEAFAELVKNGREGLCVARVFPEDITKTYGLKTTPVRWLAEEKREDAIPPTDLLGLSLTIKDFFGKAEKPVVVLQGLEYLVRLNEFSPVLRLVDGLIETAAQKKGILLLTVQPNSVEPRDEALLAAETTALPSPTTARW